MRCRKSPRAQSDPDAGPGREQFPHVLAIHGWYTVPQVSIPAQLCKTVVSEQEGTLPKLLRLTVPFSGQRLTLDARRIVVRRRDTLILRQTCCQAQRSQSDARS